MAAELDRRDFLKGAAAGAALSAAPAVAAPADTAAQPMRHARKPQAGARPEARLFLTDREAALLNAAVDVFIPADQTGPGAVEAGVVAYLDRQLAGAWGNGARMYLNGPWAEGTPQQGYQLPLTPAQFLRAGMAELDAAVKQSDGKLFAELSPARRNEVLVGLDSGELKLASMPGKAFLSMLLAATIEGYFADPAYGGNRAMAAWRMIGFPGARGAYVDDIVASRGKPFRAEPVSLADLQT